MDSIGEKLKYIRKEKGMTQEEFGISLGLTKQAVSNVENNLSNPSVEFINKLIIRHNINSNWLIANIGTPYNQNLKNENLRANLLSEIEKLFKKSGI